MSTEILFRYRVISVGVVGRGSLMMRVALRFKIRNVSPRVPLFHCGGMGFLVLRGGELLAV